MKKPMMVEDWLDMAYLYAERTSGCQKVAVGSLIEHDNSVISLGSNQAMPNLCKSPRGCLRVEKYGEDSKIHRNPADCRAIHSEVDAICTAAAQGRSTKGANIFVTRYPCESCAKAIVAAGIKQVFYGGTANMSPEAQEILNDGHVDYYKVDGWREDNTDR